MSKYDDARYFARRIQIQSSDNTGISVPGTAAASTVLLRHIMPEAMTVAGTVFARLITGGTAAGPSITFGKSLAGTGVVAAFGTLTFGTTANGGRVTATLTSTDFAVGDELVVTNVAGTVASTPAIIFAYSMTETYS